MVKRMNGIRHYFLLTSRIARQAERDKKRVERRIWRSEYKLVLRLAGKLENALDDINKILAPYGCRCEAVPGNFGDEYREYAGVFGQPDAPFLGIGDMMHAAPELCDGAYYTRRGVWSDRLDSILEKLGHNRPENK